jgi:3-hydroxyisobutyrate dehydrogenase
MQEEYAMTAERTTRVGLLGVGLMGSAMAHRLLHEGFQVIAWDRDSSHVQDLGERGVEVAGSAADVVRGADVVITMLPTADIVLSVVEPVLSEWPQDTIWLQMSSVGAAESDRLAEAAAAHGVTFLDAPVSGSTQPAEEGKLTILASGPESARAKAEPVLEALGSRVQWVGEAGMGSRLKLAANHWMITSVATLAETVHLCELMGLEQQQLVELLDGGPLGSPYVMQKLAEMSRHQYPAGFPVRLAVKDLELAREVAEDRHVEAPLLDTALERMRRASAGHADEDVAAVYEVGLDAAAS